MNRSFSSFRQFYFQVVATTTEAMEIMDTIIMDTIIMDIIIMANLTMVVVEINIIMVTITASADNKNEIHNSDKIICPFLYMCQL